MKTSSIPFKTHENPSPLNAPPPLLSPRSPKVRVEAMSEVKSDIDRVEIGKQAKESKEIDKDQKDVKGKIENREKIEKNGKGKDQKMLEAEISPLYNDLKRKALLQRKPGIFFITGFDFFGMSRDKDNGLQELKDAIPHAQIFNWNEKDKVIGEINKRSPEWPLVLVGHSLGGDTALEVAGLLNSPKYHFRNVDLLVTLDAFGLDNDIVPQNVQKNLNFIGDKNFFLNDEAHVARNKVMTEVENELRSELHSDLDNSKEIQERIFTSIHEILDDYALEGFKAE